MTPPTDPREACDNGTLPTAYTIVRRDGWETVDAQIIHERLVSVFVNGQELATMMCTPCDLEALAPAAGGWNSKTPSNNFNNGALS